MTEQELGEAVAGAHEIAAQVLAAAQQVTEAFLGDCRHVDEAQLAGGEQSRQALGVSAVGLDSVGRRFRDQTRRGDPKVDPALRRGPREAKAGRPCLIDRDQLIGDSLEVGSTASGGPSIRLRMASPVARSSENKWVCLAWTSRPTRGIVSDTVGTSQSWGVGRRPVLRPSPRTSLRGVPACLSGSEDVAW